MEHREQKGPLSTEALRAQGFTEFELPSGKTVKDVIYYQQMSRGMEGDEPADMVEARDAFDEILANNDVITSIEGIDMMKPKE